MKQKTFLVPLKRYVHVIFERIGINSMTFTPAKEMKWKIWLKK